MESNNQIVYNNIKIFPNDEAIFNMCRFLENNYDKAIDLKTRFRLLEKRDWDSLTVTSELTVQIGHIFNFFIRDRECEEKNRSFENIGDELSDVLLQLTYLAFLEGVQITKEDINLYRDFTYANIIALPILLGQLHEALLEKNEYRFDKPRAGFKTTDEFIKDRIMKLYLIIFNFAEINYIDLDQEFDKMNQDATSFIVRKLKNGTA